MKNLKLLKTTSINTNKKVLSVSLSNNYEDGVFCLTDSSIIFSNGNEIKEVVTDNIGEFNKILNGVFLYCASTNTISCFDNFNGTMIDSIKIEESIIGISLSPDESMIIILTDDLKIFILSNELQILSEYSLEQCGFGTAEPLTVGWGKKETQFHGKIGKDARNIIEIIEDHSKFDTTSPFIAWKDDGEYLAISWISRSKIQNNTSIGARMIRVFSKDGELFSTSEPTNVIENGLFWRTKANLIVTSCRTPKGLEIIFFEQNGLRHGGFCLFDQEASNRKIVTGISFNSNDDICSIVVQDIQNRTTQVLLFTTDNYHWYQKQVLTQDSLESLSFNWTMNRLHLCTESGTHMIYDWYRAIDRTIATVDNITIESSKPPSIVAVIDGNKILMSLFEFSIIPPPYCSFTIDYSLPVSFLSLPGIAGIPSDRVPCFVQTSDLVCYWLHLTRGSANEEELSRTIPTSKQMARPAHLYIPVVKAENKIDNLINSVHWIDIDSFYCVAGNVLYLYTLKSDQILIEIVPTEDVLVAKVCQNTNLYIQDVFGQVYCLDRQTGLTPLFQYSGFYDEMYAVKSKCDHDDVIVSLCSSMNQLYINSAHQSGMYTSVMPVEQHLVITGLNQTLLCIDLDETSASSLTHLLEDNNHRGELDFDETPRFIESGAEIVTVVPSDSKIILMMPRGNLESIYPRALVIHDLKRLMDQSRYSESIEKMRRARVNLNLLYDHNPELFLSNLPNLVRDNCDNDLMVLFVSELSTEDVTQTMYRRLYNRDESAPTIAEQNKVNTVCGAVIALLENDVTKQYINLILSCYVKMTPSAADKALRLLYWFKTDGAQPQMWDHGLKYLQYLISIDDLYRVALSTFDLDLTLQVAQKTQLDPKEYVAFLNELRETPNENYRRFLINMFLKKPAEALKFLVHVADTHWEEIVHLIKAHKLYVRAIELFKHGSDHYNTVSRLFAEHLLSGTGNVRAAGLVYLRTSDTELCRLAADCFLKNLDWKQWTVASRLARFTTEEIARDTRNIALRLRDIGRFQEAVIIAELYLNDFRVAFEAALDGRLFLDALRIIGEDPDSRSDLRSLLNESVLQAHQGLISQLSETDSRFRANVERLREVRKLFIAQYRLNSVTGEDDILPDYRSDTTAETSSSTGSVYSAVSNTSTSSTSSKKFKLKKKKVKNPWSDKKGSQKEEVGIIENCFLSIKTVQMSIDDINNIIEMLSMLGYHAESRELKTVANNLLVLQLNAIDIVWDEFLVSAEAAVTSDYEVQISNHIKVSRAQKYFGRRRYLLDEEFLKSAPPMTVTEIKCIINHI